MGERKSSRKLIGGILAGRGSTPLVWAAFTGAKRSAVSSVISSSGPKAVIRYLIGRSGRKVAGQPHHRHYAVLGGSLKIGKHDPCLTTRVEGCVGSAEIIF